MLLGIPQHSLLPLPRGGGGVCKCMILHIGALGGICRIDISLHNPRPMNVAVGSMVVALFAVVWVMFVAAVGPFHRWTHFEATSCHPSTGR